MDACCYIFTCNGGCPSSLPSIYPKTAVSLDHMVRVYDVLSAAGLHVLLDEVVRTKAAEKGTKGVQKAALASMKLCGGGSSCVLIPFFTDVMVAAAVRHYVRQLQHFAQSTSCYQIQVLEQLFGILLAFYLQAEVALGHVTLSPKSKHITAGLVCPSLGHVTTYEVSWRPDSAQHSHEDHVDQFPKRQVHLQTFISC